MNERERFRAALLFDKPDKVPLDPGWPRESTLEAWHRQGLPEGVAWREYLMEVLGIAQEPRTRPRVGLGVDFKMIPTFEEKVLAHRDGHYVVQDWMGAITEISDRYDYTYIRVAKDFVTRKWHSFPVQTRRDWEEKIRWRYDPHHPERFPVDFEARCAALRARDYALRLTVNGPFWQLREWCGLEKLCTLMVDDPGFVQEMVDFWADFVLQTLSPILERVALDFVQVGEDMAYKAHSMISPAMTRRFLLPVWTQWVDAVKASGCPIVSMDSDGYVAELVPLWIEAGFNCCFPVEVAAGNDIVVYRRQYGRQMAYLGGLDKRALAAGGETMHREVMRVVPPLLEEGGFIPSCDHGVPPDVSWPNFVSYTRLLAQLTGWL
jgi:uroporphyrinogen decarboxylase